MILSRPIICLVTDRRRLAERCGWEGDAAEGVDALLAQAAAAARAGIDLVQVREPDLSGAALCTLVRALHARCAPYGVPVIVNDRVDVALAARADGVHLKRASIGVADARRLVPAGWIVGRSVDATAPRAGAEGADYVVVGSVFPTRSKPAGRETLGVSGLANAVRAAAPLPVLAIGGIGRDRVASIATAGAAGLAAIEAFLPASRDRIEETVHEAVRGVRIAFDSVVSLSYHEPQ